MELQNLVNKAVYIREKYSELEKKKFGREWTRQEIVSGFVGDVGDLVKLIMAKEGIRGAENLGEQVAGKGSVHGDVDEKLAHELSDCLWSIFVIANKYDIDIQGAFLKTMDELEARIASGNE